MDLLNSHLRSFNEFQPNPSNNIFFISKFARVILRLSAILSFHYTQALLISSVAYLYFTHPDPSFIQRYSADESGRSVFLKYLEEMMDPENEYSKEEWERIDQEFSRLRGKQHQILVRFSDPIKLLLFQVSATT